MCIQKLRQIRKQAREWWQRWGNNTLPEWYFNPLITFLTAWSIAVWCGVFVYSFMANLVEYAFTQQVGGKTFPLSTIFFDFSFLTIVLIADLGILTLALLYLRKRTKYTFKNNSKTRRIILQRDRWRSLFIYITSLFVVLAYLQGVSVFLLSAFLNIQVFAPIRQMCLEALPWVTLPFQRVFPAFCMILSSSFFIGFFLKLDLYPSERLLSIVDSLLDLKQPKTPKEHRKWKKNMEYFADKFVATFGQLHPFHHRIMKEVDLTYLKPILLALFIGNIEEREKAKKVLTGLQECLKKDEPDRQVNIINWLSEAKKRASEDLPRLKELEDTVKMELTIRRGLLSTRAESIEYIATVTKIAVSIITIAGAIFGVIFFAWQLVG